MAVFAFDLAALGVIVSTKAVQASREIDVICDATHVNSQADIHSAFDSDTASAKHTETKAAHFAWLWLNPVDVFRVINLPRGLTAPLPTTGALGAAAVWIVLSLGAAARRLECVDL